MADNLNSGMNSINFKSSPENNKSMQAKLSLSLAQLKSLLAILIRWTNKTTSGHYVLQHTHFTRTI